MFNTYSCAKAINISYLSMCLFVSIPLLIYCLDTPDLAQFKTHRCRHSLVGMWVRIPPGHGCLSLMRVVLCHVEVSAAG